MQTPNALETRRRSSRVPANIPVLVTSLAPGARFSEICETLVVNAHGCAIRSPIKLETGVPVHLHSEEGRQIKAQVVSCQPMGPNQSGWRLGARLERPENFWGLKSCPEDWVRVPGLPETSESKSGRKQLAANSKASEQPNQLPPVVKMQLDSVQKQVSNEHLKLIIAEIVQPLQAEIAELKAKLPKGEQRRSSFDVSLSQIPPELEEQLWKRLRQDLGTRALEQTRQQSEQVLGAAKATIDQKITAGQGEFRQWVANELQGITQRAQGLSAEIADRVRQHIRTGVGEFQQQAAEAGKRLDQRSEELLQGLQQRLNEEHDAHRWEMQQIQAGVAAESTRVEKQVAGLSGRIAKLDEAAQRLESGLDKRLGQMAGEIVSNARKELETAIESGLKDMETHSAKELAKQLEDACAHLKVIQKGIEASVSESLQTQVAKTLRSFEHNLEDLAQNSVDQLRKKLAGGFNSLVKILGEHFQE
ncbi:MAG: hypothetical protein DMG90_11330 [Acidobacteria bacterium]|nr:MAG: hypothetical protein DMG90_11330 [Acidobacteriota bacterium]PYY09407.1 MAG: hypothetical protein DMG69_10380 [Acidobacteriota bacterium]